MNSPLTSKNPMLVTANIHEALHERIVTTAAKWATGNKSNVSATVREILHHLTGVESSPRVAALREAVKAEPWPDVVATNGLRRTSTFGASLSAECVEVLRTKGLSITLAKPIRKRTWASVDEVARSVLEALLLSPADRHKVNQVTDSTENGRKYRKDQTSNCSIYLSKETKAQLQTLLDKAQVSRSFYLGMLIADAANGTNTAARALLMHPAEQPRYRTKSAEQALE